jgi:hypothetical protein
MKNTDNYNILTSIEDAINSEATSSLINLLDNSSLNKIDLDFKYLFEKAFATHNLDIIDIIVKNSPINIEITIDGSFTLETKIYNIPIDSNEIYSYLLDSDKITLINASIKYSDIGYMLYINKINLESLEILLRSDKVQKVKETKDGFYNPLSYLVKLNINKLIDLDSFVEAVQEKSFPKNNNDMEALEDILATFFVDIKHTKARTVSDLILASGFENLNTKDEKNSSTLDALIEELNLFEQVLEELGISNLRYVRHILSKADKYWKNLFVELINRPDTKNIEHTNFNNCSPRSKDELILKLKLFIQKEYGKDLDVYFTVEQLISLIRNFQNNELARAVLIRDNTQAKKILFDSNIANLDKNNIDIEALFKFSVNDNNIEIVKNILETNTDQQFIFDFDQDDDAIREFFEHTDDKMISILLNSDQIVFNNFIFEYVFSSDDDEDLSPILLEKILTSKVTKYNIHPNTFSAILYKLIIDLEDSIPNKKPLLDIIFKSKTNNINKKYHYGSTLLFYAIQKEEWDIVHLIITKPGTIIYQCDIAIAFISSPLLFYKLLSLYNFQIEQVDELSTLFNTILQQIPKRSTADQEDEIAVTINDEVISLTDNHEIRFNLFHNHILFSLYNAHIKPIIPDNTPVPEEYKNSFQIFAERMHIISKKINEKLDNIESNNLLIESNNFLNERVISLLGKNKILYHINQKIVTTLFFGQSLSNFETRFQKSTLYIKSQKDLFEFYIDSILSKFDQKKDNFVNIASYLPLKDLVRFSGVFLKVEDLREFSYFMTTYYGYVREFPIISTTTTANPQIASPVVYEIEHFIPTQEFTIKKFYIEDVKVETIEQSSLPILSQVIYTGNMIVDAMKLSFTPSFEHAKQLTYSAGTVYSIVQGSSLYSYAIMGAEFTEKAVAGNYKEAVIDLTAKLAVITAISSIGSIGSAALTGYSLYKLLENSDKFLSKFNSNEGQIESLQTWGAIYQAFANSPLQYVFDFESRADELFAKTITIDTTLDFENTYFGV